MDIFRSVTQTVLGSQQNENNPTGADTVERLLERVQSSTLLEDRRDGCRALKALSRKYRLLVGAHGMDSLIQVLSIDRNDHEIVNYALETLVNVTSDEVFTEEGEIGEEVNTKIGDQFSEIFTKKHENVSLIMDLLDEFDFKVRYSAMKLLHNLLSSRIKEMQEAILILPSAVSKLMDMLSDTREVIRNDTLLLLTDLTKGNSNLQKIVVFENAFDHLFGIIKEEGNADGGVVVQDCLLLMFNLIKNNPSNQTLFNEGSYIKTITEYFNLSFNNVDIGWTAQKVANVHYMLKLIRTLVSPQNTSQVILSCQKKIHSCGLLENLCNLLMAIGVPADILSDTIVTVSDIVRGNLENQDYFSTVMAPSNPPRPAIVVLLMSMVNEKQPFQLRCAVLYCFQCFLFRNPQSQAQIVQTLLPQTADANQITAGQLLCGGLFSNDPISNWFSAIALSHALLDNTSQKEQLLRVQLATGVGSPPVSLLHQISSLLEGGSALLTRLGLLQLLCTWVVHCPRAVNHMLTMPAIITHLTAYLSHSEQDESEAICQGVCAFLVGMCAYFNDGSVPAFTRQSLTNLISNRIGVENFSKKVEAVLRTEAYAKAAKIPQLNVKQPSDIVFDHEFTKMFKALEGSVLGSVIPQLNGSLEMPSADVIRYKELIREKDEQTEQLKETLGHSQKEVDELKVQLELIRNEVEVLKKENEDLRSSSKLTSRESPGNNMMEQLQTLQQQLTEMTYARDYYYYQMLEKDNLLQNVNTEKTSGNEGITSEASKTSSPETNHNTPNPEMDNLLRQLNDLQLALYKKDEILEEIRNQNVDQTQLKLIEKLESEKSCFEASLKEINKEKSYLEMCLHDSKAKIQVLEENLNRKQSSDDGDRIKTLQEELNRLHNEQEDLLVLLTDQETKLTHYKGRLIKLGEDLSDDEVDDLDTDDLT